MALTAVVTLVVNVHAGESLAQRALDGLRSGARGVSVGAASAAAAGATQRPAATFRALQVGGPWDIYVAVPLTCGVISKDEQHDRQLSCLDDFIPQNLVPEGFQWWKDERLAEAACAYESANDKLMTYVLANDQPYASPDRPGLATTDPNATLSIETRGAIVASAHVVGNTYVAQDTLTNDLSLSPYDDATMEEGTFAAGYCMTHFRVDVMPPFDSALVVYPTDDPNFRARGHSWVINGPEAVTPQAVVLEDPWISTDWHDRWVAQGYGAMQGIFQ